MARRSRMSILKRQREVKKSEKAARKRAKELLGPERYRECFDLGLDSILANIRQDLKEFGVEYDEWFSERSLTENGAVDVAIERLQKSGHVYEQNGALWFRSTDYGDEKDRVLVRDNGQTTYFASDIAYHMDKLERGFDRVIDIWGADHHGYVPRVKAALKALGDEADPERKRKIIGNLFIEIFEEDPGAQLNPLAMVPAVGAMAAKRSDRTQPRR